jgi:hypothetical protein
VLERHGRSLDEDAPDDDAADLLARVLEHPGPAPRDYERPPGMVLGSEAVPGPDLAIGQHTVILQTPVQIDDVDGTFCVGLRGTDPMDNFKAMSSDMPNDDVTSWLKATECNVGNFVGTLPANYDNWCFQSTVLLVE